MRRACSLTGYTRRIRRIIQVATTFTESPLIRTYTSQPAHERIVRLYYIPLKVYVKYMILATWKVILFAVGILRLVYHVRSAATGTL